MSIPASSALSVLVALTPDECARSLIRVAKALVRRRNAKPTLMSVVDDWKAGALDESELRHACHADEGLPQKWPFEIHTGTPSEQITSRARQLGAQLIMLGLNLHRASQRADARHTVRAVMAESNEPVLALRRSLKKLPHSVVVPVDFSRASIKAAHFARRLLDSRGLMHLVFVDTPPQSADHATATQGTTSFRRAEVESAFNELRIALAPDPGMTITTIHSQGDVLTALLQTCNQIDPDLVALGSSRRDVLTGTRANSITRTFVDESAWSVLVAPAEPDAAALSSAA